MLGRPCPATRNQIVEHDFIELFQDSTSRIFEICAPLYVKGHSLKEIARTTGFPYTTIQSQLVQNGVTLRPKSSVGTTKALRHGFKSGAPPPFGYRYIASRLEKDTNEYPILIVICRQWQSKKSATVITHYLNRIGYKTRNQKIWKRTTVLNIIERFENGNFIPEEELA